VTEDAILLGYDTVLIGNWSPVFWRSTLCSFKTLETYYLMLQCHIKQKWNTHLIRTCIILKVNIIICDL